MQKTLIVLVVGFLAVGCGKTENATETKSFSEEIEGRFTENAKAEMLKDSLVGTYKLNIKQYSYLNIKQYNYYMMFRKDGICEKYFLNDKGKEQDQFGNKKRIIANWEIKNDELFVTEQKSMFFFGADPGKGTMVLRIEKDGSLTGIAGGLTLDGNLIERRETELEAQETYKKIK